MELLKKAKWTFIAMSVLAILLGAVMLIWPGLAASTLCIISGALALLCGIIEIIAYFTKDSYGIAFGFNLALGLFLAVFGVILMLHPSTIVNVFTLIIGIFIIIDSFLKLQTSIELKRSAIKNRWIITVGALLSGILGVLVVLDPFSGAEAIMIFLGISLIFDGIENIVFIIYTSRVTKKLKNTDTIYIDVK